MIFNLQLDGRRTPRPPLTPDEQEAVQRWQTMIVIVAARFKQRLPRTVEIDDLVAAGTFGLVDALRGYNPARGLKFTTYARWRIHGSMCDYLRELDWVPRLARRRGETGPEVMSLTVSGPAALRHDTWDVPDPSAPPEDGLASSEWFDWLLGQLHPVDAQIVNFRFRSDLTQDEIGERVGLSPARVSQRLTDLLARLRERLAAHAA